MSEEKRLAAKEEIEVRRLTQIVRDESIGASERVKALRKISIIMGFIVKGPDGCLRCAELHNSTFGDKKKPQNAGGEI